MQKFIRELSAVWNTFSDDTKGNLATLIAGKKNSAKFTEYLNK